MKKATIKKFSHAEVDALGESFGYLKIPSRHEEIRCEGEDLEVSDGYHTFEELYEHRIELYIALCYFFIQGKASYDDRNVWMSDKHSDGSEFEGWFVMGIGKEAGKQITYHLPNKYWHQCKIFSEVIDKAPEYDGHTPVDVIRRLQRLIEIPE